MTRVDECTEWLGACWWETAQAIGTVGAFVLSLALAVAGWVWAMFLSRRASVDEARARASMVAAWADSKSTPATHGGRYVRQAMLRLENQSEQPVFNVYVEVVIAKNDGSWLPLGPISAPTPVRVLPPRGVREWDISLALLPYTESINELTGDIAVSLYFDDPWGQRWSRGFERGLERVTKRSGRKLMREVSPGPDQLGPDGLMNPLFVTRSFLESIFALEDGERDALAVARGLLDPAASGWQEWGIEGFVALAREISDHDLASYVHYPAPRIAYVKLLAPGQVDRRVEGGPQHVTVQTRIVTLRFVIGLGWRIFNVGAPEAFDLVPFPEHDLNSDVMEPPAQD